MTVAPVGSHEDVLNRRGEDQARPSEMWEGHPSAPALALAGVTAALGLGAAASGYRWTMRIVDKVMPLAAAFVPAQAPPAA